MILNLDPAFNPFPKKKIIDFEAFTFSGGEPHIKISKEIEDCKEVTITHRIRSFNDFGLLLIAIDALKRTGVERVGVFIPYFPGARQDRVMVSGEALSVKVYADLLNHQDLNRVTVYDPHSEVTPALINNCEVIANHGFIQKVKHEIMEDTVLIAPDGGALKKIYKVAVATDTTEVIECSKVRDVTTGRLSGFKIYTRDLKGRGCLIVDDICDGGKTFTGLAKKLKQKNAGNIYLAVSHGIFSKGFDELNGQFKKIFTTNSFRTIENTKQFKQVDLKEIIQ